MTDSSKPETSRPETSKPDNSKLSRRDVMIGAGLAAAALGAGCSQAETQAEAQTESQVTSQDKSQAEPVKTAPATVDNTPTKDAQVRRGIDKALELSGGKLDVLINNAGISYAGPIEVQDMEATRHIFDTNVFGPQRMARAALPAMRKAGGGFIVNVTSQLGRLIIPAFGMYSPTKFALEAMSEQMAYELVAHNIDVTIIQPGGYPTKIWDKQRPLSAALKTRLTEEQLAAYPTMTAGMGADRGSGGGDTDPMDIPREIAKAIAMPQGTRPLRREVHPGLKPHRHHTVRPGHECGFGLEMLKLFISAVFSLSLIGCSQGGQSEADKNEALKKRPNPPYFPIGENCHLPDLSPDMEVLQTRVMERLSEGISKDVIDKGVLERGTMIVGLCGRSSNLGADYIPLFLRGRNLEVVNSGQSSDYCPNGSTYTALISSLAPVYPELVNIQCEALTPTPVGNYGLKICVKDQDILDIKVTDRTDPVVQAAELPDCPHPPNRL